MKTISQHIEHVRTQPHHVRKQIAIASAAATTFIVALIWFAGSISTGAFALNGGDPFGSYAERGSNTAVSAATQNLAGVGAATAFPQTDATPAHIEIIDAAPAAGAASKQAEQTTIPF